MTKLQIGIADSTGTHWISGHKVNFNPKSKSYNIAKIDSKIKFGNLAIGTYYYKIFATDANGTTRLLNQKFKIIANTTADNIVNKAKSYIGKVKYKFGYRNPNSGYCDCSGFTQYIYKKVAGISLGGNCRLQVKKGKTVSKSSLVKGDLVFFQHTYKVNGASHVGIYVGSGKFISCCSSGVKYCKLSDSYWKAHWLKARRVL